MWHPQRLQGTGEKRKAFTLASLYRRELFKYKRGFLNTWEGGEVGPLVSLLLSFGKMEGLVVGPWGNGSKDLHDLSRTLLSPRWKIWWGEWVEKSLLTINWGWRWGKWGERCYWTSLASCLSGRRGQVCRGQEAAGVQDSWKEKVLIGALMCPYEGEGCL